MQNVWIKILELNKYPYKNLNQNLNKDKIYQEKKLRF